MLGSIRIQKPSLSEQTEIANFLDRETAKIDALLAKKDRLIELLQEKRAALITRAVTKGLNPNVPLKDSGVEWLGKIPAHWQIKQFRHACVISEGQGLGMGLMPRWSGVPRLTELALSCTRRLSLYLTASTK